MEEQNSETEKHLQELPFTYVKTEDPGKASYSITRHLKIRIPGGKFPPPLTDEQILEKVKTQKEASQWYLYKDWREKGQPVEQIEFQVGDKNITVYNFNKEKQFTNDHIERTKKILKLIGEHFPQILDKVRWILINNEQEPSKYGDESNYPLNGTAQGGWRDFKVQPRGMELFPHRIAKATNFEGTLIHELTHLIEDEFREVWKEKFQWRGIGGDTNVWEKKVIEGRVLHYFNKRTGEIAPIGSIPLQPEQCIDEYAKILWNEDVCESMVAYFFDPELLRKVSPDKFEIIKKHDVKKPIPKIEVKRIPKDQIKLPEVKPKTVLYFIKEPED